MEFFFSMALSSTLMLAVILTKSSNFEILEWFDILLITRSILSDGCMMHMSSVAGGALTIYVRAMLQYKLYTDYNFIQYRIKDVRYTAPETYIVLFLAVLAFFLLIKIGSAPLKCLMRVLRAIRFSTNSKQFHSV